MFGQDHLQKAPEEILARIALDPRQFAARFDQNEGRGEVDRPREVERRQLWPVDLDPAQRRGLAFGRFRVDLGNLGVPLRDEDGLICIGAYETAIFASRWVRTTRFFFPFLRGLFVSTLRSTASVQVPCSGSVRA